MLQRIEIDGRVADPDCALGFTGFGHFTAMQVRARRTRGMRLHMTRLAEATKELFGATLDVDEVRAHVKHALDGVENASARVYVLESDADPTIVVTLRPPATVPPTPQRLQSVPYVRPVAHIKHIGNFAQGYYARSARRNGYDDALLSGPDGAVSEGTIANIGFFAGSTVVWPDAPQLAGITMQLLDASLLQRDEPARREPIQLAEVRSFDGAFLSNSHGVVAVSAIDDIALPVSAPHMSWLAGVYDGVPWDRI